jgi:hypothetical protein
LDEEGISLSDGDGEDVERVWLDLDTIDLDDRYLVLVKVQIEHWIA